MEPIANIELQKGRFEAFDDDGHTVGLLTSGTPIGLVQMRCELNQPRRMDETGRVQTELRSQRSRLLRPR